MELFFVFLISQWIYLEIWNLEKTEISQAMLGRNPHMEILDMLQVQCGRPSSSLSGSSSRELDEGGVAGTSGLQPVPGQLTCEKSKA